MTALTIYYIGVVFNLGMAVIATYIDPDLNKIAKTDPAGALAAVMVIALCSWIALIWVVFRAIRELVIKK